MAESVETTIAPSDVQVSVNKHVKLLHFSDGVDEEVEEVIEEPLEAMPAHEPEVDPSTLGWGSWFYHYATKAGTKTLNAVDYAGEGLANFFGITSPKYQLEIEEYERIKEENKKIEEESAGWRPSNVDGKVPLVIEAPTSNRDKIEPV